ncbi:Fur family transcriptional regulator [Dissulfurirhabdus thermomarina]|nr:Fur family transcriptional regulator [Dissulfurirhabdus thermomarina]
MLARLRERKFRITPQRLAVLKILSESRGHPGVEAIYRQVQRDFPTTSLATIYKTISLLKELGEVLELGFPEGGNRYDGNRPYPHPHVVCIRCRKIMDLDLAGFEGLSREVSAKTGFRIVNHRVDFFGICPECQEKNRKSVLP